MCAIDWAWDPLPCNDKWNRRGYLDWNTCWICCECELALLACCTGWYQASISISGLHWFSWSRCSSSDPNLKTDLSIPSGSKANQGLSYSRVLLQKTLPATLTLPLWRYFHWSAFDAMVVQLKKVQLECKARFSCAQLMLRQMHRIYPYVSRLSIRFLGHVLTFNKREYELWKLYLNLSFCAITADSKSRWPHVRKEYFRGVLTCLNHTLLASTCCLLSCQEQNHGFWATHV